MNLSKVKVVDHPVIHHKLGILRNKSTSSLSFRTITEEISQFLAFEATRDLKTRAETIETPLQACSAKVIDESVVLVAIMRAGNGMLSGMMRMLPFATIGHIGIYRDKFIHSTVEYYLRLPSNLEGKRVLLLDPLLATGETAAAAIARLKDYGVGGIRLITLLAAPVGIEKIQSEFPDVEIYTLSVENGLDSKGYILPGLGDAGDRLFDTLQA